MKDYNKELSINAILIETLAKPLKKHLEDYHVGVRQDILKHMKSLHMLLRETAWLIQERDFATQEVSGMSLFLVRDTCICVGNAA